MSELKFNMKDPKGDQVFITPLITVANGDKVKVLNRAIRLSIAYIVKAVVEGDGWQDKTKMQAGLACHETLTSLPKSAKVNLYMPSKYEDRDNEDMAKWDLCATVPMTEMSSAAVALAKTFEVMVKAEAEVKAVSDGLKLSAYEVRQPVYFAGETARAKTSGGNKKITITL